MVLLVGVLHVFSFSCFIRPISSRMSVSSLSGYPRCAFTLINRVAAFAFTRCCSFTMMVLRTSASTVLTRLSLAPPPIHLLMTWRVTSLSVRYSRFSLSGCASRYSRRSPSSGRLELGARSRERVFAAYFGGGDPAFFLFYTGRTKLLIFTGIFHFFMTYFMSASTKRSSRAATCL